MAALRILGAYDMLSHINSMPPYAACSDLNAHVACGEGNKVNSMSKGKEILQKGVQLINSNELSQERMSGWVAIVQFELKDESPFHLRFSGEDVTFVDAGHDNPTLTLTSDADTIRRIYGGEEDIMEAIMAKKLIVNGKLIDGQKFQSIILPALES
jgi:putative sterol carrier protein